MANIPISVGVRGCDSPQRMTFHRTSPSLNDEVLTFATAIQTGRFLKKKFIIPLIATVTFALGTAAMLLPFLPFGWILYGATVLLLVPYFGFLQSAFKWIASKDNSKTVLKISNKIVELYTWAEQNDKAEEIKKVSEEAKNGE